MVELFAAEDLPEGEICSATLPDGTDIAVYNVDGAFYATADRCTHGEASLSEDGILDGKEVECSWHFGTFDVTTGEPCAMPCTVPLRTYSVSVIEGMVYVEI